MLKSNSLILFGFLIPFSLDICNIVSSNTIQNKILEDDGDYDILYRLPKIFISEGVMELISILLGLLIILKDYLLDQDI